MQTFLPLPDLRASLEVLDDKRLGKQRVETFQILRALTWPRYAWKNHPAVRMWRGFIPALVAYGVANCDVWTARGYADTVRDSLLQWTGGAEPDWERLRERGQLPPWLGVPELHVSHQSALVRKDPSYYRAHFPDVPDDLPYWWPPDVFPRWPARRPAGASGPLPVPAALDALGLEVSRAGQAEGVDAVGEGRDVLATMRPGHGGSTTGLLAGLSLGHAVALS
ncbi:MAG: MSMEG_6728 family protein, partial [Actinomycetota bacterium]|nr:MSMEG_6728 family protein [Actinomycetota bacterium]